MGYSKRNAAIALDLLKAGKVTAHQARVLNEALQCKPSANSAKPWEIQVAFWNYRKAINELNFTITHFHGGDAKNVANRRRSIPAPR